MTTYIRVYVKLSELHFNVWLFFHRGDKVLKISPKSVPFFLYFSGLSEGILRTLRMIGLPVIHSSPSKLVQIPDFSTHLWHNNYKQTQQNSCQDWYPTLPPTTVFNKSHLGFFLSLTLSKFIKKN